MGRPSSSSISSQSQTPLLAEDGGSNKLHISSASLAESESIAGRLVDTALTAEEHTEGQSQHDNRSIGSSDSTTSEVFENIESFRQYNPDLDMSYSGGRDSSSLRALSPSPLLAATSLKKSKNKVTPESERLLLTPLDPATTYRDSDDDQFTENNTDLEAGLNTDAEFGADGSAVEASSGVAIESNAREDDESETGPKAARKKILTKRIFVGALIGLSIIWVAGLIFYLINTIRRSGAADPGIPTYDDKASIELDDVMSGTFRARRATINWLDDGIEGHDGLYSERNSEGKVVVGDYSGDTTSETKVLIDMVSFDYENISHSIQLAMPGLGLHKVLLGTDTRKNWRHSYYASYWIYDVHNNDVEPLIPGNTTAEIRLATWSPRGDVVAFVLENNLFIRNVSEKAIKQVTTDGNKNVFYGIPDWVYEEEVFSGNSALWWSNDGKFLSFLRSNDSTVPEYTIPYFDQTPIENSSYPDIVDIKYPKAGYSNPIVELMFLDLSSYETFLPEIKDPRNLADDDRLITEVIWAGSKVIARQTNRESDLLKIVLIDPLSRTGSVVREEDISGRDGGWFEVTHDTAYVPANKSQGLAEDGYIDTVIVDGYNHLAYFSPLDSAEPKAILTSGKWEVVDAPSAVDLTTGTVYFIATKKDPTERHLYSVKLDGSDFKNVTDESVEGYYSASFSTGGRFLLLSYNGPKVPWQNLIDMHKGDITSVTKNDDLEKKLTRYRVPEIVYSKITVEDDVTVNVFEIRPANFNPANKYPVLFHLYAGPGSQTVDKRFTIGFEAHISSALDAIVVSVDGRGTGFMGREFRSVVRDNLGYWESRDQILIARQWKQREYVDQSKIAIWGWSYGGYMTLKTLEQDGGENFKYGMAVAPVTDWRFYDSIYTERYMHTPQHNLNGYDGSAIKNVTALKSATRFLVMHGTGDDNVHFQNTLTLLDKFDLEDVENYDMYVFPDSDHSIFFHNANKIVYNRLDKWLTMAFNGMFEKRQDY
ncbi:dipeptidyl peptidase IV N-terminal region-domain-containing protein [Dipodascopsis uninucleata]